MKLIVLGIGMLVSIAAFAEQMEPYHENPVVMEMPAIETEVGAVAPVSCEQTKVLMGCFSLEGFMKWTPLTYCLESNGSPRLDCKLVQGGILNQPCDTQGDTLVTMPQKCENE